MDLFAQATKMGLRFETPNGNLATEDLWSIKLVSDTKLNLNDIAKDLNRKVRALDEEESFVDTASDRKSKSDAELRLKLDVVKAIIAVKIEERDAAASVVAEKERKDSIKELIAKKESQQLESLSLDELRKLL